MITSSRWHKTQLYTEEHSTIADAVSSLLWGEALGMSSWEGVYVDGVPIIEKHASLRDYAELIGVNVEEIE